MDTGAVPEHAGRKLGRGHFLRAAEEYLPTGGQFGIVHGDQSAIVTEVGATLRSFSVAGLELLVTFGVDDGPLPRIFQVYTGDTLPEEDRRRGIAIELMACAPNAFNRGDGLRVLAPASRSPACGAWLAADRGFSCEVAGSLRGYGDSRVGPAEPPSLSRSLFTTENACL